MKEPVVKYYPVAETFSSVQGEGSHAGRLMLFVRLAGCSVGKPFTSQEISQLHVIPTSGHEKCTAWDGQSFVCDTVYKMVDKLTPQQILERRGKETTVCITGGEPLMHDLEPLFDALIRKDIAIHIETSGTVEIAKVRRHMENRSYRRFWITVSPKYHYLPSCLTQADEIKVLVDKDTFNSADFVRRFEPHFGKTFLQPINGETEINFDNLNYCLKLIQTYPRVRLSVQLHKFLHVR